MSTRVDLEQLYRWRRSRHLRHRDMAAVLGMSRAQYGRLEAGCCDIRIRHLCRIADVLQIPIGMLFTSEGGDAPGRPQARRRGRPPVREAHAP